MFKFLMPILFISTVLFASDLDDGTYEGKWRNIQRIAKTYGSDAEKMERLGKAYFDSVVSGEKGGYYAFEQLESKNVKKAMDAYKGSSAYYAGYVGHGIPLNWNLRFLTIEHWGSTGNTFWFLLFFCVLPILALILLKNAPDAGFPKVMAFFSAVFLIRNIDYALLFMVMMVVFVYILGLALWARLTKG